MPIRSYIHPDGYCVLAFSGKLLDQDVYEGCLEFYDTVWKPGEPYLTEVSQADASDISVGVLQKLAELAAERNAGHPQAKVAVFAPQDLPFGLARMYAALARSRPGEVQVFRNRDEAVDWMLVPANP